MAKSIDIKIGSYFDKEGINEANKSLAKLAADVKSQSADMRQATLRAGAGVNTYADEADKAVRSMGGGYKTLGQQLSELSKGNAKVGEATAAAADVGSKSFGSLEMVIGLCRGSTEQLAKAFAGLTQRFPVLQKVGVAALGAWAAAITSVITLLASLKELVVVGFNLNQASESVKETALQMERLRNEGENFAAGMSDARKESDRQAKIFEDQANALNKVTKAQLEFNRAQAISLATSEDQKKAINAQFDAMSDAADVEASSALRENKRNVLLDEGSRLRDELANAEKMRDTYQGMILAGNGGADEFFAQEAIIEEKKKAIEDNARSVENINSEEEAAQLESETRDIERQTKAKEEADKLAAEKAKQETEVAKKAEDERLKAVEAEKKAREAMEAELHKQRADNLKAEIESAKGAAAGVSGVAQSAQTEFDRAFAMYRDPALAASGIAEERDYAADYKQLGKDANRYGGSWRINELASLMASGDTAGQAAKLEEWRKSSKFSPEVEAMVRASAADKTKTTAEDELRKINANTANLDKKLDELLSMK